MVPRQIENVGTTRAARDAPSSEAAFFLAALTFALAMLSLFAVLAIAGLAEFAGIAPFFALPLLLFGASALLLRRWLMGVAETSGAPARLPHARPLLPPGSKGCKHPAVEAVSGDLH